MPETLYHFLYACDDITEARDSLIKNKEDVFRREDLQKTVIGLAMLTGNWEEFSKEGAREVTLALLQFIRDSERIS